MSTDVSMDNPISAYRRMLCRDNSQHEQIIAYMEVSIWNLRIASVCLLIVLIDRVVKLFQ